MFSIWIPQIAAFLAALLVSWGAKHGFTLGLEATTATFVGVFTIVKTVAGRYLNPGNVNAPELVEGPKHAVRAARRDRGV